MLDKLKDLGFKYSTLSGISISIADVKGSEKKPEIVATAQANVDKVNKQFKRGLITDRERYEKVVDIWMTAFDDVKNSLADRLKEDKDSSIAMMTNSKARGDLRSYTQLVGMRGLFNTPSGDYVEIPVLSSFSEGITISEFFISTHGTRKGAVDTALKTADAGYLTRRLVDVSQDIIVKEEDCGSTNFVNTEAFIKEDGTIV
jgi:DNA-directed RNA polymerase subunit beta'